MDANVSTKIKTKTVPVQNLFEYISFEMAKAIRSEKFAFIKVQIF